MQGKAGPGLEMHGRHGGSRFGLAGIGTAGMAGRGLAWHGLARQAWSGVDRSGIAGKEATMVAEKVKTVSDELNLIRKSNGGFLDPAKVVEFARNPETLLHSKFTWDDGKAAEQYRLWQARQVIRVSVTYEELPGRKEAIQVRTFFSLPSDRRSNGYRSTDDIMKSVDLSAELLTMAKLELRTFRQKYKNLKELADVFSAIDNVL